MPKVKGTRASAADVSAWGAGGKEENPPVITKEAGSDTMPKGRTTGKQGDRRGGNGGMAHDGTMGPTGTKR